MKRISPHHITKDMKNIVKWERGGFISVLMYYPVPNTPRGTCKGIILKQVEHRPALKRKKYYVEHFYVLTDEEVQHMILPRII